MISKISKKLANYYINKKTIDESEREIYEYCFDILVSTFLNIVAVIILGIITLKAIEVITFLMCFMFLRRYCAGAHAKTHWGCFFSLMIIISILIFLQHFFSMIIFYIGIVTAVLAIIVILILAPVDCKNNTIEEERRKLLKKKANLFLLLMIVLIVALSFFNITRIYSFPLLYAIIIQSILLIIGRVQKRKLK